MNATTTLPRARFRCISRILATSFAVLFALISGMGPSAAVPLEPDEVPAPLKPWIDWVLGSVQGHECPFLYNSFAQKRCAWPGELQLDLSARGGSFVTRWQVFSESWVALPGSTRFWPDAVDVNGTAHAVVARDGRPSLYLQPGVHTITGRFVWARMPESLSLPTDTGIVALVVDGTAVEFPNIDHDGQLWLGGAPVDDDANRIENSAVVNVVRRIVDDIPLQVFTRIELDVTGEQRELVIGTPLLDGFVPVALASPLPARLEPDGRLRVQLRAGHHVIEVRARHRGPIDALAPRSQPAPWPGAEQWAFEARPDYRQVEIEGVVAVDPRQTRVPQDWYRFPVFNIAPGASFELVEVKRGDPIPEPDKLSLAREMWLDFDGAAYTIQDRISGSLSRSWRLDSGADLQLGQVVVNGEPQFITYLPENGPPGVELRGRNVKIVADGRMSRTPEGFAASAWLHDFQNVEATLHLPPGWDVFAIDGIDNVPPTWLARWTLLDLFLVLVLAAAALRLWQLPGGIAALLMLTLTWHAPGAPQMVWLALFVTVALLRVMPPGRMRATVESMRYASVAVLLLTAVPFVINELKLALYPQLDAVAWSHPELPQAGMAGGAVLEAERAVLSKAEAPAEMSVRQDGDLVVADAMVPAPAASAPVPPKQIAYAVDPDAIVQTGTGIPDWRWRALKLSWNGPVDPTQRVSVIYIPPAATTALHVLRVLLLGALLFVIAGAAGPAARGRLRAALSLTGCIGLLLAGALPNSAQAEGFPDPALLDELRNRLLAPPECMANCADLTRMMVTADADTLQFRLEVHNAVASAIPLPGHARHWTPQAVLVDGVAASAVARDGDGTLWVQLSAGIHQLYLAGGLPDRRTVQVPIPLRPHAVELSISDWRVDGVRDDGLLEAQLQLTRLEKDAPADNDAAFAGTQLPAFVRVERTLQFGLDWTVSTRVRRLAPGTTAAILDVPLLDGESVLTPGVEVIDGNVRASLAPNEQTFNWTSVLTPRSPFTLAAPVDVDWLEAWILRLGPIWHATFDGIAPVHDPGGGADRSRRWRPWPGETLSLTLEKPLGVSGQTLTIDNTRIVQKPGKRATDTRLTLDLRSSKGGQYTLQLPEDVSLQAARIDGQSVPLRPAGRALTIPLTPGAQSVALEWRRSEGIATTFRTDPVDFAISSINHRIEVELGQDRWVLFTSGPRLGPAVLFWSLLAALLLVAFGLSRVPLMPLTMPQWLLLAIGLSQVPVGLAAIVVGWLLALGARERYGARLDGFNFNLVQIGLAILTAAAFAVLFEAIRHGLLGHPDMHVSGNGSSAHALRWYADRIGAEPPRATVWSVPILAYRLLMLAWALWLALAILKWLRWGWQCFSADGLWRAWRQPKQAV